MPGRKSTLSIRKKSVYLNRGEQGEVRSFVDPDPKGKRKIINPFGTKRGQAVKILHSNGLFRPRTYFNTWLAEARELDSVKKMKLQREVHNIVALLFPGRVVRIPMIRFPETDFTKYTKDLSKLESTELVPELYMEKVEEPEKLKELKRTFYDRLKQIQDRMQTATLEERQRIGSELVKLRLESDPLIGRKFPEIYELEKEIEAAGFDIQHPEVNFGIKDGKVIFYDLVPRLNLEKLKRFVANNPNLTDKQRKLVSRRIEAVERLGFTKEELWDRRKTYFDSMTKKGVDTLSQVLRIPVNPKSKEDLHSAFYFAFSQDFFDGQSISQNQIVSALNSIQRTGQYRSPSGRIYSVLRLGSKIILKINVPTDMVNDLIGTDIGMPGIELNINIDALGRLVGLDMIKTQLVTVDLNYLIKNKLVDDAQIRQLYT